MNEIYIRHADLSAGSYNAKAGTFTAIASSGQPVPRMDYDGKYVEALEMTPKAVRLDRFRSGRAPLLDNHRRGSLADQIGVISDARLQDGKLIADVRLSNRSDDRMKSIRADLAAGIIRNVSIGYRVFRSAEDRSTDGPPIITHTDWEPMELSIVMLPADSEAYIRSMKGPSMPSDNETIDDVETSETEPRAADDSLRRGGATALPRPRLSDRDVRQIYAFAAQGNMPGSFAEAHIARSSTMDEVRADYFDRLHREANRYATAGLSRSDCEETFLNPEFLGRAIEEALYTRMTGAAPEGPARELAGLSLLELGARMLQANGERVSWANRDQLVSKILTRSHTTTDFPMLLTGAGNRTLMQSYQAAESPLKRLARRRDAADFRAISTLKLSEAPRLLKVPESGEVKYGSRSEAKEGFKVETYARMFSISRQSIINDDLGAFADSNFAWGRAAAETEADLLVSLFTVNGGAGVNLDDGDPLYTTGRKNKAAAGTAIDIANLGAARQAMREVKGLDGVTPKHLVVGPAKETQAEQVLTSIAAAQVSDANPFSGRLTLHVEPRFAGNAWRLFADSPDIGTIVIAYLNGQAGPILETQQGWSTLGVEFRATLDFGCGINDWRGSYLNSGE